jgi:integrase
LSSTAFRSYSESSIQKRQYQPRFQPASFIAVRIIHIPGISIPMPGILIHILLESLFTSPRNRYSHAPEYASKSPKGRRFVPIGPRVRQALLARSSEQKQGWIFPSKRAAGGHLTTVTKQFEKARKEAGLPNDLVLYCARHGFGTEMYRATKNLFAVMNVMGHTTVSTTMKYQHQDIDEVAAVASHRVQ